MAHPGLPGGKARPCAHRSAAVAGRGPRAAPASPPSNRRFSRAFDQVLLSLFTVPPIYCFVALFNFVFWCRTNVEDVVSQTFCNLMQFVAFYPTLLLSAIPGIQAAG